MAKSTKESPVMVTTAHKGVFFGYVPSGQAREVKAITLARARMCVYWTEDMRGIMGLASLGPGSGCKIGPAVPSISLSDVTVGRLNRILAVKSEGRSSQWWIRNSRATRPDRRDCWPLKTMHSKRPPRHIQAKQMERRTHLARGVLPAIRPEGRQGWCIEARDYRRA